jgi:hypothetical protein
MKTKIHRALACALLEICVTGCLTPLGAQQARLSPKAVGQIADEVLTALIPSTDSLDGVSIAKRPVLLDAGRTLASFGYSGSAMSISDLGIRSKATAGSQSVLNECNVFGDKPCSGLGWNICVWIEPISVSDSQARVRGYVSWVKRATPFAPGIAPIGNGFLEWYATEVFLARSPDGKWKFVRKGVSIVGD